MYLVGTVCTFTRPRRQRKATKTVFFFPLLTEDDVVFAKVGTTARGSTLNIDSSNSCSKHQTREGTNHLFVCLCVTGTTTLANVGTPCFLFITTLLFCAHGYCCTNSTYYYVNTLLHAVEPHGRVVLPTSYEVKYIIANRHRSRRFPWQPIHYLIPPALAVSMSSAPPPPTFVI